MLKQGYKGMSRATWLSDETLEKSKNFNIDTILEFGNFFQEYTKEICEFVRQEIQLMTEIKQSCNLKFYADYKVMFYFYENFYTPINKIKASVENLKLAQKYYAEKFYNKCENEKALNLKNYLEKHQTRMDPLKRMTFKVIGYKSTTSKHHGLINLESVTHYGLFQEVQ